MNLHPLFWKTEYSFLDISKDVFQSFHHPAPSQPIEVHPGFQLRFRPGELLRFTEVFRVPLYLLVGEGAETALAIVAHQEKRGRR